MIICLKYLKHRKVIRGLKIKIYLFNSGEQKIWNKIKTNKNYNILMAQVILVDKLYVGKEFTELNYDK